MEEVRFYPLRRAELKRAALGACVLFIEIVGLSLSTTPVRIALLWVGIILTSWLLILTLLTLLGLRPVITLSKEGIRHGGYWYAIVPWEYVDEVRIETGPSPYIFLTLRNSERFFHEVPARPGNPWYARKIWSMNGATHAKTAEKFILFGSDSLAISLDQLKQTIEQYRSDLV